MKQLDNVELFVCSEDNTSAIGFADKAEIWTEGGGTTIILRGINGDRKDLLRAENECLRRDVEFYKNLWRARGGGGAEPTRQPEVDDREFIQALEDYAAGRISYVDVAATVGVALVESEPTEVEKWKTFCVQLDINLLPWQVDCLAAAMEKSGIAAPKESTK